MNTNQPDLQREGYTIPDVSAVSGIGRTSIYKAISEKKLTARKCGNRTIILRNDLQAFLQSLPVAV